ncbi:MAG: SatD family protein [Bacteroidetes bacterium]|nr:SatD family protein [Bacteroidota bacterium]
MDIDKNKNYAVLTGDVIGSSSLPDEKRSEMLNRLRKTYEIVIQTYSVESSLDIDIFSGDSWQILLVDPSKSIKAALLFRSYFKGCQPSLKVDTRISIGVGSVSSLNPDRLSQSDGEAFRMSGRALSDTVVKQNLHFSSSDNQTESIVNAQLILLDFLSTNWTEKQALAVAGALMGLSQTEIGNLWEIPIKQQSVADFLSGAGWKQVEISLDLSEKWLKDTGI